MTIRSQFEKPYKYLSEYVGLFVKKWDELIDCKQRAKSEGLLFIDVLKSRGKQSVLDVATGTGFALRSSSLKAGFDVFWADGAGEMLAKAFENSCAQGVILKTIHADWRWLEQQRAVASLTRSSASATASPICSRRMTAGGRWLNSSRCIEA